MAGSQRRNTLGWHNSPETIAKRNESLRRWREENPEKKPTRGSDGRFHGKRRKPIAGVYAIVHISGSLYVGSSADIYGRYLQHISNLRRSTHPSLQMQADWIQERTFHLEIIEEILDRSERLAAEQRWLNFFKPEYNASRLVHSGALTGEERKELGISFGRYGNEKVYAGRA